MIAQIVAFLALATSAAFADSYGYCYPEYGSGYVNAIPAYVAESGFRVLNGCGSTLLTPRITATPEIVSTVGAPEIISSCEPTPIFSSGLNYYGSGFYGCGSPFGGRRSGLISVC